MRPKGKGRSEGMIELARSFNCPLPEDGASPPPGDFWLCKSWTISRFCVLECRKHGQVVDIVEKTVATGAGSLHLTSIYKTYEASNIPIAIGSPSWDSKATT